MKGYTTIENTVVSVTDIVEKSKFIGHCKGVKDETDALSFIAQIKKKHYDATHNCSAFIVGDIKRYSDDGEPQGTAGMPILECISNKGLRNICVVVTRYFGGVKLGAGGLVRAYNGSASHALNSATKVVYKPCVFFEVKTNYNQLKTVTLVCSKRGIIKDTKYDSEITMSVIVLCEKADELEKALTEATFGRSEIARSGEMLLPYDE